MGGQKKQCGAEENSCLSSFLLPPQLFLSSLPLPRPFSRSLVCFSSLLGLFSSAPHQHDKGWQLILVRGETEAQRNSKRYHICSYLSWRMNMFMCGTSSSSCFASVDALGYANNATKLREKSKLWPNKWINIQMLHHPPSFIFTVYTNNPLSPTAPQSTKTELNKCCWLSV